MASASNNGHGVAPSSKLDFLLVQGDDVIISVLDNKLYFSVHKVAKRSQLGTTQDVLQIVRGKARVVEAVICEVETMNDPAVQRIISQIFSEIDIPITLVHPGDQLVRDFKGTSTKYSSIQHSSKSHIQFPVDRTENLGKSSSIVTYNPVAEVAAAAAAAATLNYEAARTGAPNQGSKGGNLQNNDDDQVIDETAAAPSNNDSDDQGAAAGRVASKENTAIGVDLIPMKRQRVVWTTDLRQLFIKVYETLGDEQAVPRKILEHMNVPWLKRENVASYLQKYRLSLKKDQNKGQVSQDGTASKTRRSSNNPTSNVGNATDRVLIPDPGPSSVQPGVLIPGTRDQLSINNHVYWAGAAQDYVGWYGSGHQQLSGPFHNTGNNSQMLVQHGSDPQGLGLIFGVEDAGMNESFEGLDMLIDTSPIMTQNNGQSYLMSTPSFYHESISGLAGGGVPAGLAHVQDGLFIQSDGRHMVGLLDDQMLLDSAAARGNSESLNSGQQQPTLLQNLGSNIPAGQPLYADISDLYPELPEPMFR